MPPPIRPARLVVVTGTGTEVGKTWFAAATLIALRNRGSRVAARKPVQSFDPGAAETDADVLAKATGEAPTEVCPAHRWIPAAMAPPMAAHVVGAPAFTIRDLVGELVWHEAVDVALVEGVGGPRSPLARDGDTVDLVTALDPDLVVLVADAALGVINAVRLSATALANEELVVALNRFNGDDDLHRRNRAWLDEEGGFDVVTSPGDLATRITSFPVAPT